ncbi:sensor histidine kinase [Nocardiopsis coralliicola]
MTRGSLRVYLGAAPGVGKTYRMLEEAHRRRDRGTDVAIGVVECHGRALTEAMIDDLEAVPLRTVHHRGRALTELDTAAVLARAPQVALIDELAHSNVPGSGTAKRWQDIDTLLGAGIDVLSTLNIQHLESLNDVVEKVTGVRQGETVPDAWVRAAGQIELVDMTPEALRRRIAHGNVCAPDRIDSSLANYFGAGNLSALRELSLLWLADRVEADLEHYRSDHGVTDTWETRERVVVALTGGPEGATLIRRAARSAERARGADLMAVHVTRSDGLTGADPAHLARQRVLAEHLGGTYHQVLGEDVSAALLAFARGANATQLVLGASRRGRLARLFAPGIGATTIARSGPIDVHLVSHEQAGLRRRERRPTALSRRRRAGAWLLAAAGLAVTAFAFPAGEEFLGSGIVLVFAAVTGAALAGGLPPALFASVGGFAVLDLLYTEPYRDPSVAAPGSLLALAGFSTVAVALSAVVDQAARRTREAAQAGAEAQLLATVAGNVLRGSRPLEALMERLLETFSVGSAALLQRVPGSSASPDRRSSPQEWTVLAAAGEGPPGAPRPDDTQVPVDDSLVLVLRGGRPQAGDRRVIEAFAAHAAIALRQERLAKAAAEARPIAEADRLRAALLSAVSHDLRAPLAAAKASVTSLRSSQVDFTPQQGERLLAMADEALDQLTRLVGDLLDMSRLQAGVLGTAVRPLRPRAVVEAALGPFGEDAGGVRVDVPADLPEVAADPGLLDRVLANLLANALRFSPPECPPRIAAHAEDGHVVIAVADRGPGVPEEARDRMFVPFQRLGDSGAGSGLGLGLALAQGFTGAMGGTLTPATTPGGGLTMSVRLPAAPAD